MNRKGTQSCPVDEIRDTKLLFTIVAGKVLYERK
jgi:hypothetical protein